MHAPLAQVNRRGLWQQSESEPQTPPSVPQGPSWQVPSAQYCAAQHSALELQLPRPHEPTQWCVESHARVQQSSLVTQAPPGTGLQLHTPNVQAVEQHSKSSLHEPLKATHGGGGGGITGVLHARTSPTKHAPPMSPRAFMRPEG